jgi:polysaccharide biosynthesis protein PslG
MPDAARPISSPLASRARRLGVVALAMLALLAACPSAGWAVGPVYRGVELQSLWSGNTDADVTHDLDLAHQLGSNVVRLDIAWSSLETDGRGQINTWYRDKVDSFTAGAQARGMKVLAVLWATPCWASSAPDSLKQSCTGSWWDRGVSQYPPRDMADYTNIAHYVAARWGTRLAGVEIWNEPNNELFLNAPDQAAAFTSLVKAGYSGVKAADPNVQVVTGGLMFADRPFLEQLYADGIKGNYDAVGVHPYNEWRAPGDLWQEQWKKYTLVPGMRWIRDAQQAAGDDKPLWLTEYGWSTCVNSSESWCVPESEQSTYTADSFRILAGLDYVRGASLYTMRDPGTDPSDREASFGIVKRDFTPKPAFSALKAVLTDPSLKALPVPDSAPGTPSSPPGGGQAGAPDGPAHTPAPAELAPADQAASGSSAAPAAAPSRTSASGGSAGGGGVKVNVKITAPGQQALVAVGKVSGQAAGTVRLAAFHAAPTGRFRQVSRKLAVLRGGAFKARLSAFQHGRWRVTASLTGKPSVVGAQRARLSAGTQHGPARGALPPGVRNDGRHALSGTAPAPASRPATASGVAAASFGGVVSPGPLRGGGYVALGTSAPRGTILFVQHHLAAAGERVPVRGRFDARTAAAVRRFQAAKGLLVDGIVGRQTAAALAEQKVF